MILAILLTALPQVQAPAVPQLGPNGLPATTERCLQVKFQQADKKPEKVEPPKARFSPLTELPPGDMHLTVMRRIDGCHVPTIVKYGIGRGGR